MFGSLCGSSTASVQSTFGGTKSNAQSRVLCMLVVLVRMVLVCLKVGVATEKLSRSLMWLDVLQEKK